MFCMYKVCILAVEVKDILQHAEYQSWDGENLRERTEADLAGDSDKEGHA